MHTWQLQEASNKLGLLIDEAITQGPQMITRYGRPVAVVLSLDEYRRLTSAERSLVTFFRESPLAGFELDLERDQSGIRDESARLIAV